MKILLDGRFYGLEHAGLGRYTINLVNELGKLDKKNRYILLLRGKYYDSLKLPANWKKILTDYKNYSLGEQLSLPKIISTEKPDIVHFLHFNIPIFWSGKYLVTIHDMTMHRQGRDATNLSLPVYLIKRLFYKFVFKKAMKTCVKIITPSYAVKNELTEYFRLDQDKIIVTYEGVEQHFSKIRKQGDMEILGKYELTPMSYFFYVGNAYPHKNLKIVAEALVALNKNREEKIKFAVACSRNIFTERLINIISGLKAEKDIKLLGFVSDDDLKVLYKNSIAFIYPSLSEGFGLQGLEAMSSEALVIVSDIPVFREIYKDNVLYFDPYDGVSILATMREVLEMSYSERNKLISSGKNFIKRYSWSKMAKETLRVYENSFSL